MRDSPIGLIKGRTPLVSEPQWLLNIGGSVTLEPVSPVAAAPAAGAIPASVEPVSTAPDTRKAAIAAPPVDGKKSEAPAGGQVVRVKPVV